MVGKVVLKRSKLNLRKMLPFFAKKSMLASLNRKFETRDTIFNEELNIVKLMKYLSLLTNL